MSQRKIGDGHAQAMLRLGLRELRNAVNPSRESVADNEIGLYGTMTQGEIAQARGGPGQGPEQEASSLKMTLEELRGYAKEIADKAEKKMDRGDDRDRGGLEM
jgi:hypothetical protein